MKLVLLSGGSGKRLWPLSNDARSKQFLKVLRREDGQLESMAQRVWRQLKEAGLDRCGYIATSREQADMVQSQLGGGIPIVVEPERRDTFPAIALAAVYLYSVAAVGLDEVVAVLPVDPYVGNEFFYKLVQLENVLLQTGADLALIGVRPTYPAEKYGYIVPEHAQRNGWHDVLQHAGNSGSENAQDNRIQNMRHKAAHNISQDVSAIRHNMPHHEQQRPLRQHELAGCDTAGCLKVDYFREKPAAIEAERLISRGAMWNCGVFAFKLQYMIDLLMQKGLPLQYEEMAAQYSRLPKISFDYEVVEKAGKVVALPYEGSWKDLGTWNTLTEEMAQEAIGRLVRKEDSPDTHVINELDIPVVALGLSHVVVAASPDGILVADKSASPRIKAIMQHHDLSPMCGEKAWGHYKVLEYRQRPSGSDVRIQKSFVNKGGILQARLASTHRQVWTVLDGEGEITVAGNSRLITAGDVVTLPQETEYRMQAFTDMEMIEVQYGMAPAEGAALKLGT